VSPPPALPFPPPPLVGWPAGAVAGGLAWCPVVVGAGAAWWPDGVAAGVGVDAGVAPAPPVLSNWYRLYSFISAMRFAP
jgi:hypothetical protein